MTVAYAEPTRPPHPVSFDVAYPERLSRVTTFFRLPLAIPQLLAVWLLGQALGILTLLAWFAILFTGRYPKAFFEFTSGVVRWRANVHAYAALLRDEYPPFSWEPGKYPLTLDIPHAGRQSRFRLFIRWIAILPNSVVFFFVEIGWLFTSLMAWSAILITGRYPRGLFKFAVGALRWDMRRTAYQNLLRDEYPPYRFSADAPPGNEVLSLFLGLPLFALQVAFLVFIFAGAFTGGEDVTVSRSALTSPSALERTHPQATAGGVRLTLLGYEDPARPVGVLPKPGWHFVSFTVHAQKSGWLPGFYWPIFFGVDDCTTGRDHVHGLDTDASAFAFRFFFRGGSEESTLYFQVPNGLAPCELSYFTFRGFVRFRFR